MTFFRTSFKIEFVYFSFLFPFYFIICANKSFISLKNTLLSLKAGTIPSLTPDSIIRICCQKEQDRKGQTECTDFPWLYTFLMKFFPNISECFQENFCKLNGMKEQLPKDIPC